MPVIILMLIFAGCVHAQELHDEKLHALFEQNCHECVNKRVTYKQVPRGLVISVDEQIFFDDGSAELKEGSRQILDEIAGLVKDIPNNIVVEDHAEGWEISTERASSIVDYMVKKLPRDRVSALGDWNTTLGRVDFVIIQYDAVR